MAKEVQRVKLEFSWEILLVHHAWNAEVSEVIKQRDVVRVTTILLIFNLKPPQFSLAQTAFCLQVSLSKLHVGQKVAVHLKERDLAENDDEDLVGHKAYIIRTLRLDHQVACHEQQNLGQVLKQFQNLLSTRRFGASHNLLEEERKIAEARNENPLLQKSSSVANDDLQDGWITKATIHAIVDERQVPEHHDKDKEEAVEDALEV